MNFCNTDKKSKDTFYSVKRERIEAENLLEERKIEVKDSKDKSLKSKKLLDEAIVEFKNIINDEVNESENTCEKLN